MRLLVTGREGQVVSALLDRAEAFGAAVIPVGRPELDLERPETLAAVVERVRPDVVVSAAAYTAVDAAEGDAERARIVNAVSPGVLAAAAAAVGAPVIQLSTDYVFDGRKPTPYVETDPTGPQSVYGATKLEGEQAVAAAAPAHVILRTAWVYSAGGKNFVRTMLRLAGDREEVSVVGDQRGCPTFADDIADGVLTVARRLSAGEGASGVFHMAGAGETTWAGFAEAIFEASAARGGPTARVRTITTADYPTPAPRPANSRLDCARLEGAYGVALPHWRDGLERCLDRLLGPRLSA